MKTSAQITQKLNELQLYSDDVLVEYIAVMMKNEKKKEEIEADLSNLLNEPEKVIPFVHWLFLSDTANQETYLEVTPVHASVAATGKAVTVSGRERAGAKETVEGGSPMEMDTSEVPVIRSRPNHQPAANPSKLLRMAVQSAVSSASSVHSKPVMPKTNQHSSESHITSSSSSSSYVKSNPLSKANDRGTPMKVESMEVDNSTLSSHAAVRVPVTKKSTISSKNETKFVVTFNKKQAKGPNSNVAITAAHDSTTGLPLKTPLEKQPIRCTFWPDCRNGEECQFIHPTEVCRFFPRCTTGAACLFIHPAATAGASGPVTSASSCKFGLSCTNRDCTFSHPSPGGAIHHQKKGRVARTNASPMIKPLCGAYPDCTDTNCSNMHPSATPCKYGEKCVTVGCKFRHPLSRPLPVLVTANTEPSQVPCRYQEKCTRQSCIFLHFANSSNGSTSERVFASESVNGTVQDLVKQDKMEISLGD